MGTRRLQIKRHTALVAIGEVPGVSILGDRLRGEVVRNAPQVAARWLHLDDVGAEVGQNHGGARTRDEAREVRYLKPRKNIVVWHFCLLSVEVQAPMKRRRGRRSVFPGFGRSSRANGFGPRGG